MLSRASARQRLCLLGLIILTFTLFGWRAAYSWMVKQPFLRERVYVLGTGERAQRLVKACGSAPRLELRLWAGPETWKAHSPAKALHRICWAWRKVRVEFIA